MSMIRSLVNAQRLKLECIRILLEGMFVSALLSGRSRFKAVQMDDLKFLGIWRIENT